MFYLLEDINRIFDSEKDKVEIIEEDGVKFLRNEYGYKIGEITKQSENVFDFVECGDLVAQKKFHRYQDFSNIFLVYDYDKDNKLIIGLNCAILENNVYAIYKPNEYGDYIKVWERKKELCLK